MSETNRPVLDFVQGKILPIFMGHSNFGQDRMNFKIERDSGMSNKVNFCLDFDRGDRNDQDYVSEAERELLQMEALKKFIDKHEFALASIKKSISDLEYVTSVTLEEEVDEKGNFMIMGSLVLDGFLHNDLWVDLSMTYCLEYEYYFMVAFPDIERFYKSYDSAIKAAKEFDRVKYDRVQRAHNVKHNLPF